MITHMTLPRSTDKKLVDYSHFDSLEQALESVERERGYDDLVKSIMCRHNDATGGEFGMLWLFFCSMATRMRGLHDSVAREIRSGNPHSSFSLIRQLAETIALAFYVADHPRYVETIAAGPGARDRELPKRKSVKAIIDHMDRTRADQYGRLYADLCKITHFDNAAMWISYEADEDGTFTWTSFPRFKDDNDLYAVGLLAEMSVMIEHALETLGAALLKQPQAPRSD